MMYRMSYNQGDTKREELRAWVARRLGKNDVHRPLWDLMEQDGYVEAVLDSSQNFDREDLLGMAKERIEFAKEMVPFVGGSASPTPAPRSLAKDRGAGEHEGTRREAQIYDPLLDPLAQVAEELIGAGVPVHAEHRRVLEELLNVRESPHQPEIAAQNDPLIQRAEAFSLYLAKLAHEDPNVKRFRREVLGDGATPSVGEAEALLFSPAAALLSAAWFKENGVPIIGHTAGVVKLQRLSPRWPYRVRGKVKVKWDGGQILSPFEGVALSSDPFERGAVGSEPIPALKGSMISDLVLVDEHLRGRFPWRPLHRDVMQVPMFLLTGRVPWVEPIRATVPEGYPDLYQTVDITVWPWVPVEEVTSLYERARKELNPTPTTSPKRLALLVFVMMHPDVEVSSEGEKPKVPPWRELLRSWNEQYPEGNKWHYPDVRNFRRDFNEAFDQVVNFYRSGKWFTKIPPVEGERPE